MLEKTKVTSFYSFKGGTGRSTSLANAAYAMADMGVDVGCMDLDLAAPGLHMIFPEIGPAHDSAKCIHDYIKEGENPNDVNMDKYVIDVGEKIGNTRKYREPDGSLLLLSGKVEMPGDDDPERMVQKTIELMHLFIEKSDIDFLLLDSRSGLSSHMVPVFHEADKLFTFHRWTDQHKMGTKELAEWLTEKNTPNDLVSVASNVSNSVPDSDVETWVRSNLSTRDFNDYHIINRSDILKDEEKVITLEAPEDKVSKQYYKLAEKIVDN